MDYLEAVISWLNQFTKSNVKPNSGVNLVVIMAKLSPASSDVETLTDLLLNLYIGIDNDSIMQTCLLFLPSLIKFSKPTRM